jgi:ABC-type multidrug transport system ATPase subunit
VFGESSYGMSQRTRNRFGIVLDEGGVYGEMTPWEHMLFFGRLRGLDKQKIADRFKKLAEHFELKSTAQTGRFSKGI